ncbi:MAG: class I SAM-dependent methyltransferase [Crocinitomicaceae bacterium]
MSALKKYLICKTCQESNLYCNDKEIQCASCGKVYRLKSGVVYATEPTPSVGSKYARQSARKNWSKWRQSNYEFLKERLVNFTNESIVIDLGCGESPFGDILERFDNLFKVDFTDYEGVNLVCNLTENLPIKSDSMDIVIASNTLEHLPDTDGFLNECHRILKSGGSIIITVPFLIPLHQEPFDFLRFTEYQLEYLLKKSGFSEIKIKPLSNFFEIYQSTQSDFLNASINHQKTALSKLLLKVFRKIQLIMTSLMFSFFESVEDRRYPKGYGIVARK